MHHAPTAHELKYIADMSGPQRTRYFLTRTMEAEEIWALADSQGWLLQEQAGQTVLPIWPYRQFVDEYIDADDVHAGSVSLEHFVENILTKLVDQGIGIVLWPTRTLDGTLLSATELQDMFTSLMDSSDYSLEG